MPTGWTRRDIKTIDSNNRFTSQESISSEINSNSDEISRLESFTAEKPRRNLEELIVSKGVRTQIDAALNQIIYQEELYNSQGWNLISIDPYGPRTAINLYGDSGTGKSFCAEAIANHLNRTIVKANYAEIQSKYPGETEKNIVAAFDKAKETESVLFFDEADSILGKRLTEQRQSADASINSSRSVMLIQLDIFDGIVIFATNFFSNYDPAFIRRILAHIRFELPDQEALKKLWEYLFPKQIPRSEEVNTEWLSTISEGLSGGDILNVVKLSAGIAISREGNDKKIFSHDIKSAIDQVLSSKNGNSTEIYNDTDVIDGEVNHIIS